MTTVSLGRTIDMRGVSTVTMDVVLASVLGRDGDIRAYTLSAGNNPARCLGVWFLCRFSIRWRVQA
jgi:hypothetical protein